MALEMHSTPPTTFDDVGYDLIVAVDVDVVPIEDVARVDDGE